MLDGAVAVAPVHVDEPGGGLGGGSSDAATTLLAQADLPVSRRVMPRDQAVEEFKKLGEHYKAEIIAGIPANEDIKRSTMPA